MKDVLNCIPALIEYKLVQPERFLFLLGLWLHQGKKSFHIISVKSHNAELKLCNLHQFAEAFNGIASCKIFRQTFMFHHFTINCIWLMPFLHELKQVWCWSNSLAFSIETFLSSRYYSHVSTFSNSVVRKRMNLVKAFKFSK